MQPGRTLSFIAVFVSGLLVTLTSVSADHFCAGGVLYSPPSDAETSVQCQFLGVKSISPPREPVIPTTIQCTVVHKGGAMSFQLFTVGKDLDFRVERDRDPDPTMGDQKVTIVTLTGKMRSRLVLGVGSERRHFTELAPFEAVGVDRATPGEGKDSFTLTIDFSARQDIGQFLSETLGTRLVGCKGNICTLKISGTVRGEVEGHTSGDA